MQRLQYSHRFNRKRGFTLVELVIAIAVAGVVISGVVVTSAELVRRTADPMMAVQRVHIAQSYLDEIESQEFALSGANCSQPAGGRSEYTHICQYRAISNSQVQDQFGNVPAGLTNYSVSVAVSSNETGNSSLGITGSFVPNASTALVTVTVRSPDNGQTVLSGYFVDGS
ncbi:MAG TPA: hypothetical protein DHW71_12845 [Gammaproteobacteria bacterium]|nr:type II secretion system protein [Pseudomonadota bacterium]HBF07028.1 hypothetical protein [Gammaproteobacteria bacterium]HCK93878.1 hypothetical protein [Gammaproteobacteria bacterium]|tara:strand:+ start:498 stop:1007 length:510 start_codon:yes stop_codon:yes gene_type:complete